jgi:signal transduction histidine kinase
MAYRRSLRFRIRLSFATLGLLLALLFVGGTWVAAETMEATFIEATLLEELEYFVSQRLRDPASPPPRTRSFRGYVVGADEKSDLPPALRGLEQGVSEIEVEGRSLEVAVAERGDLRFVLAYDETRIEDAERVLRAFLAIGGLALLLLSTWLGFVVSHRVLAPVTRLAEWARSREPRGKIAEHFAGADELQDLARAFDGAVERLEEFARREAELTADASHELRTSASVIRSTLELMRDDPGLSDRCRERLKRLDRASEHMTRQIEVFLLLARESPPPALGSCSLAGVVREVADRYRAGTRANEIEVEIEEDTEIAASPAAVDVVVGNLVANALAYGQGPIRLRLTAARLAVIDEGPGIAPGDLPRVFERGFRGDGAQPTEGTGLGLPIVQRVCERFGWTLELDNRPEGGFVARVAF